jgi:hypothetical protein
MHTDQVLTHLKKHGQLLDSEIASAMKISLTQVRESLTDLSKKGEISLCTVTRFNGNKRIDGFQCRISGYFPPAAPGRKVASTNKTQESASSD